MKLGSKLTALVLFLSLMASSSFAADWTKLDPCVLSPGEQAEGDAFRVKAGDDEYIFRLYFVDAPETDRSQSGKIREQAVHWDISEMRIPMIGRKVAGSVRPWVGNSFTVFTKWEDAGSSGTLPGFYAVIRVGKEDLGKILVEEGLARVSGPTTELPDGAGADALVGQLKQLEDNARSRKRGVWGALKDGEAVEVKETREPSSETGEEEKSAEAETEKVEAGPVRWANVPTVAFMRAEAFINVERFEEAEVEMRALLERYPDHDQKPRIEFYLALSLSMQESFDEAVTRYEQWLKDYPQHVLKAEVQYWLSVSLYYSGRYAEAMPRFADYAAAYPNSLYSPEAQYRAALCRYALEDFKGCAIDLGGWLERYPDHYFHWEALVTRADALAAEGMLEQARDEYRKVTSAAGAFHFLALTQLAKVYKALGTEKDYQDMAAVFAQFIRENPDSPQVVDAAFQAGAALRQIGRVEDAQKLYWNVVEKYGNNNRWEGFDSILNDLAAWYSADPRAFDQELKKRLDEAMKSQRFTLASRLALTELENMKGADLQLAALDYAQRFKGDFLAPESLVFLGNVFYEKGHEAKARGYYQTILRSFPESLSAALAHTREAGYLVKAGEYTNALAHTEAAVNNIADPGLLMEATYLRGQCLLSLKKYPEAVADLNTVLASRTTPRELKPQALLALASAMEEQGNVREAIPYYQRIYVLYQAYTGAVAQAYLKSGSAFEKLRDVQSAVNTYREMLNTESLATMPEAEEARKRLARISS